MNSIPRISVVIICYNQDMLIRRAIHSLLVQREYIYQICVSDDCSTDKTWDVLNEYSNKYPGLFKLHRNEPNVGIFENIEKSWTMPDGDVVYGLSGDDVCGKNWFKTVIEFIRENNIDYKNELFCIYSDHKCIYPNGDSFVVKNKHCLLELSQLKKYERGLVFGRGKCYSINVLKQFRKTSCGKSFIAENSQDAQGHIFAEKLYYIPQVGNIYYASIGVSSNMSEQRQKEHEQTMVYAFECFRSWGIEIDKYDEKLPAYNMARKHFISHKTFFKFINMMRTFFKAYDPRVGLKGFDILDVRRMVFRIIRRLPHKKPINW